MSRLPGSSQGTAALTLEAKGLAVIEQIGYMPDALVGALRVRILDLMAHHRAKVGQSVASAFRGGRKAQKFWFARSFQYTDNAATNIGKARGESFAVGLDGGRKDYWSVLQVGARISAAGPMLIPFPTSRAGSGKTAWDNFAREFGDDGVVDPKKFGISPAGVVYAHVHGVASRRRGLASIFDKNRKLYDRGIPIGVIRKARTQRKLLRFFESFNDVYPRHVAEFDRMFDLAITATGRETLVRDAEKNLAALKERLANRGASRSGGPRVRKAAAAAAAATRLNPIIDITTRRAA